MRLPLGVVPRTEITPVGHVSRYVDTDVFLCAFLSSGLDALWHAMPLVLGPGSRDWVRMSCDRKKEWTRDLSTTLDQHVLAFNAHKKDKRRGIVTNDILSWVGGKKVRRRGLTHTSACAPRD